MCVCLCVSECVGVSVCQQNYQTIEVNSSFITLDHSSIFHYLISIKDKTRNLSSSSVCQVMNVHDDILKS